MRRDPRRCTGSVTAWLAAGAAARCCRLAQAAQAALPAVAFKSAADGVQTYSLTFQILILMTLLTLLPAILLAMTAFTRIIIVLSILRQALGMATTPSNQVLTGLALFLTFFVMGATLEQSYASGIKPYLDGQLAGEVAIDRTVAAPEEIHAGADPRKRLAAVLQALRQAAIRERRRRAAQRFWFPLSSPAS